MRLTTRSVGNEHDDAEGLGCEGENMKRNVFACGALVLGMIAGFVVRGTLETADAIPPQTQASAEMITEAQPASRPALQHSAVEDSDEYRMFLQIQEKTETGYVAVGKNEKETELLPEPMHRVSIANIGFRAGDFRFPGSRHRGYRTNGGVRM